MKKTLPKPSLSSPLTLSLADPECVRESLAGGKAARLAQMTQAGFPVPPGFVITVAAFQLFLEENRIPGSPGFFGEEPAALMAGSRLPEVLLQALTARLDFLKAPAYAVRSSAPGEDGLEASMAGQFVTFLNVPPNEVGERVKDCWAALFSGRVAAYRRGQNLPPTLKMAVLVQVLVKADFAGVAFSLDPRWLSPDEIVVEWVEGLGETLVSGKVTPKRMRLRRKSPSLPEDLPPKLAAGLRQLWDWLFKAEALFCHPLDVEWAVDEAGIHILQARPITGLSGNHLVIWSNVNIGENYPQALTPLAWSVVEPFRYGYFAALFQRFGLPQWAIREAEPVIRHLLGVQGGRVYYNLSHWYDMLALFPLSRWFRRFLDHYIGQRIPFTYRPSRGRLRLFCQRRYLCRQVWFWLRLLWNYLTLARQVTGFEEHFYERRARWRQSPLASLSLVELEELLQEILDFLNRDWGWAALADLAAMVFPGLLEALTQKWLGHPPGSLTAQLLRGLKLKSTEGTKLLWDLARRLASQETLKQLLTERDYEGLEQALDAASQELLDNFLEKFGGRCYHELLIFSPTFEERRDLLWDIVRSYCLSPITDPRVKEAEEADKREALTRECLKGLAVGKGLAFRRVLRDAQQAVQLREAVRLCQSLIYGEIRRVALELGARLARMGYLKKPTEVFFLTVQELSQVIQGKFLFPGTIPELIALRHRAYEEVQELELPEFFLLPRGRYFRHFQKAAVAAPGQKVWKGLGLSGGRNVGPVRVVFDPSRESPLQPGEILVAQSTDPGWTPLFLVAGGLILEKGGLLSHGAIVAREFGIPAVAGVDGATRLLPEGSQVLVDGDLGEVRLLD